MKNDKKKLKNQLIKNFQIPIRNYQKNLKDCWFAQFSSSKRCIEEESICKILVKMY